MTEAQAQEGIYPMTLIRKILVVTLGGCGIFMEAAMIALFLRGSVPDLMVIPMIMILALGIIDIAVAAYLASLPNWGGRS